MRRFTYTFLLLLLFGYGTSSNPDDSLPVYMRGMNWNKVQEYLNEDLRLSDAVIPQHYAIELSVNVRGHAGAQKSDFKGTVTIYLNITKPVDKIELHSNGLTIEKARLIESVIMSTPAGVSRISSNPERETITIHANRTIQANEEFRLQISYSGLAKMDEYGLFESWDPKLNKSLDSNGPFILASRNFPTGARFWFPCFDEPSKKATLELQINHPTGLNAYSNTHLQRTERIGADRTLSVFEKTRLLPTYQIALSVNHLSSKSVDVKGYGKVRLISSKNSHNWWSSLSDHKIESDIPGLLKNNLEFLNDIDLGEIPKEKLDVIVIEGTFAHSIQPGLLIIGRDNFWRSYERTQPAKEFRNLTQVVSRGRETIPPSLNFTHSLLRLVGARECTECTDGGIVSRPLVRVGNMITVRSTDHMWLNDMFSYIFMNETYKEASHLLKLLTRFCPAAKEAFKIYIVEHTGGFADIDDFINTVSKSCEDRRIAKEFLEDFINQAGKVLLHVKRSKGYVTIQQTRYHSTYFNSELRDTKTRYTLPVFYSIDGQSNMKLFLKNESSIIITVPETSLFLIDHEYEHLYFVYYEDSIVPQRNYTEQERIGMVNALRKSMIGAINIGFVKYIRILEQQQHYLDKGVFVRAPIGDTTVFRKAHEYIQLYRPASYINISFHEWDPDRCEFWDGTPTSYDGLFNNDTRYWEDASYIPDIFVTHMHCIEEWNTTATYRKFLENNFLGENTVVRPQQMANIAQQSYGMDQWMDLHRLFFRNAANFSHHRFDLLADTVLNQANIAPFNTHAYPDERIRDDYLNELRTFVIHNPRRAASMSTEIEMRLEREFLREERPKWHDYKGRH